jgi:hypothetical protein
MECSAEMMSLQGPQSLSAIAGPQQSRTRHSIDRSRQTATNWATDQNRGRMRTIVICAVYLAGDGGLTGGGAMVMTDNYATILDDTARRLDTLKLDIDAWCARALANIEQRYRDDLDALRRSAAPTGAMPGAAT